MRRNHNTMRRHNESGFTLIEVTLALAVALIGMLAVLGLLPQGMQAARSAADNTISATIVNDVFSDIRTQPFHQVNLDGTAGTYDLSSPPAKDTLYYDYNGVQTNPATANKNYYYQVDVQYQSQSPQALCLVTASVIWPALSKAPPNTNIFITAVTLYP